MAQQEEYQLLIQEPDPTTLLYHNNGNTETRQNEIFNKVKFLCTKIINTLKSYILPDMEDNIPFKDKSDKFFQEVYLYYENKGFTCILLEKTCYLIITAFVITFSTFLFGCIDYSLISENTQLSQIIIDQCIYKFTGWAKLFLSVFVIWWLYTLIKSITDIIKLRKIYSFYTYKLNIPDKDMQTISWKTIVDKIIELSKSEEENNPGSQDELDAHKIVNKIMRKENYIIALINKDCLDFSIPFFGNKQVLTKVLEWNVEWCINNYIYDIEGHIKPFFLERDKRAKLSQGLSQRFKIMGILNLVLLPFLLIFLVIYIFFRYAEEIYHQPGSIVTRSYSLLARWKFRQFNELPHEFEQRLNRSYENAMIYINQFPNARLSIIARLIVFIAGSFISVLTILTLVDQEFFNSFEITKGCSVLFYIGIFTTIVALTRTLISDDHKVFDPQRLMVNIAQETHYFPQKWKDQPYSDDVRNEFESFFDKKIFYIFKDIYGLILTPLILILTLPNCSSKIIEFFQEFTVDLSSVGYICSFAVFDFRKHGNPEYGYIQQTKTKKEKNNENLDNENKSDIEDSTNSDDDEVQDNRLNTMKYYSNEGKMELSFLDFRAHYDTWKPKKETGGQDYLSYINNSKIKQYPMLSSQLMLQQSTLKGKEPEYQTIPEEVKSTMFSSSLIYSAMEDMMVDSEAISSRTNFAVLSQIYRKKHTTSDEKEKL